MNHSSVMPGLHPGDPSRPDTIIPRVSGVFEGVAGSNCRSVGTVAPGGAAVESGSPTGPGATGKELDEAPALNISGAYEKFRDSKVPDLLASNHTSIREYEGGGSREDLETPIEQIRRLQSEIAELSETVGSLVAAAEASAKKAPDTAMEELARFLQAEPHALLNELHSLRSKLEGVSETVTNLPIFQPPPATDAASVCSSAVRDQLVRQLEEHLRSINAATTMEVRPPTAEVPGSGVAPGSPETLVYDLYPSVDPQPALDRSLILDLERRLAGVEDVLGVSSSSHLSVPFANLTTASKEIAARLSLMHPARLASLSPDCKRLNQKLDLLQQQLEKLSVPFRGSDSFGPSINESVVRLYEFCEASRTSMSALPAILRRLKALKWLHQEAAGVGSRLQAIEHQQAELEEMVNTMNLQFEKLKEAVQENIQLAMKVVSSRGNIQPVGSTS